MAPPVAKEKAQCRPPIHAKVRHGQDAPSKRCLSMRKMSRRHAMLAGRFNARNQSNPCRVAERLLNLKMSELVFIFDLHQAPSILSVDGENMLPFYQFVRCALGDVSQALQRSAQDHRMSLRDSP
ncbi:MAG: hypothetical protein ACKVHP_08755 [Verrucomicrobiales bacterium]